MTDTVAAVLAAQARTRAEHPLLICDEDRISYAHAQERSARLARALVALGAGKGTHVGLLFANGSPFVVAALAAARIGAIVVPFSTLATAPELRRQLAHGDVRILLAASSYRSHDYRARLADALDSQLPELREVVFDLDGLDTLADSVAPELLAALEADVDPCDPLAIIYTSGSTGTPKGVIHTHGALLGHQRNLNQIRGLAADDVLFCNSPFFWIGGFAFGLLATLTAGSTLVCSNATDPARTLELLESAKPTVCNGFAATVTKLAEHPSFATCDLSSLRRGNLYPIMAPDCRPADPELRHNMLGLTETGGTVLLSSDESDQPEHRRGSFGKPAPGFEVKVVGPDGEPVPAGDPGELCFRGPYLMQRYHRRSREDSFDADGWFHTGDAVCADLDGFLYFLGRSTAMIKTAGADVSPVEVENAIARVGGLTAHVVGLPDPDRGQVVAAVLALRDGQSVDEGALLRELAKELSSYKIPRRLITVAEADIAALPSGKVDRWQLREHFGD
ncbi:acyl-CoA synthetase (AMP-forming)/AMP-acid ligase II [Mycobacterium sp. MAA66]|uniref:class I adenylate-forming enzyme family protein n=1 Tax=Mycobacterium sp. MAA66 TaxID=3156297 RepID=UPI0035116446